MFVEGSFSWDREGETTALEWPPLLTPEQEEEDAPREATVDVVAHAAARTDTFGAGIDEDGGEIVMVPDPDLTEAELRATRIDSLVRAAFIDDDGAVEGTTIEEANARPVRSATVRKTVVDEVVGDLDEGVLEDESLQRPRRSSRTRGPLLILGTAVTVALSGGYTAEAFGWRLPPTLQGSVKPMTDLVRTLTPSRLVDLVDRERLRLLARARGHGSSAMSTGSEASSETVFAPPVGPMSTAAGAPGDEPMSMSMVGDTQAATSASSAASPAAAPSESSDEPLLTPIPASASPVLPPAHERGVRATRGVVWSPAAQALVPASDGAIATSSLLPSAASPMSASLRGATATR